MNQFARLIDKRKNTVWGWQHAQNQIPINDLLRICKRLGISLVDFLYAESFVLDKIDLAPPVLASGVRAKRRPPRQLDREFTKRALSATLKEERPHSMRAVAEKLNLNKRLLHRHFPELCKAISARHKQFRQAQYDNRRDQHEKEVKQTTAGLRASGTYPSRRRVAKLIRLRTLHEASNCGLVKSTSQTKYHQYSSWDLSPPNPTPRSRLYHLTPVGVGTPRAESLTHQGCVITMENWHAARC
jgi:hypothetical protein